MKEHMPLSNQMKDRSRALRSNMTRQESKLWYEFLKFYRPHFRRQYIIGQFIADFYCPKAKLIIELDGSQHYSDFGLKYDQWRTKKLDIKNNCVLRYTNWDLVKYFDSVCDQIDYITIERLKELAHEDLVPKEI